MLIPASIYDPLLRLSGAYRVDRYIVAGMVNQESGWNPKAVGDKGHSIGLLQLHDAGQGAGMSKRDREDPAKNLEVGIKHLEQAFAEFGNYEAAIAAHNAGAGAVRAAGGDARAVYDGSVYVNYVLPVLGFADQYRVEGLRRDPTTVGLDLESLRIQLDTIWGVSEALLSENRDGQSWTLRQAVMVIKQGLGL